MKFTTETPTIADLIAALSRLEPDAPVHLTRFTATQVLKSSSRYTFELQFCSSVDPRFMPGTPELPAPVGQRQLPE